MTDTALETIIAAALAHASRLDHMASNPHNFVARGQSATVVNAWAEKQREEARRIHAAVNRMRGE